LLPAYLPTWLANFEGHFDLFANRREVETRVFVDRLFLFFWFEGIGMIYAGVVVVGDGFSSGVP
jgi:hypothetical protein